MTFMLATGLKMLSWKRIDNFAIYNNILGVVMGYNPCAC